MGDLLELSKERHGITKWLKHIRESVPCINSVSGTWWANLADTKKALHVTASPNIWAVCGGVNYHDDGVYCSMVMLHKQMLANYQPRVMVYNGNIRTILVIRTTLVSLTIVLLLHALCTSHPASYYRRRGPWL